MAFVGKSVLVTGASGGIGAAVALKFAREGAAVALLGRNQDKLQAVTAHIRRTVGASCAPLAPLACDLTVELDVERAVTEAVAVLNKRLDVLVNNAGVLVGGAAHTTLTSTWDKNFDTNAKGAFLMLRACSPHLITTQGNIVNVSSVTGMQSFANAMAYCASKAAVDMMTKCAALDLAPSKVRVNSINPGVIRSELQKTG